MIELKGISASPGLVKGKAFVYIDESPMIPKYDIQPSRIAGELERFQEALDKASFELEHLKKNSSADVAPDDINFLDSHLLMLQDPEFKSTVERDLKAKLKNVEWILHQAMQALIEKLSSVDDQYLKERSADIHDVSQRVLNHLMFRERISLAEIHEEIILVGRDLMPSEAIGMNQRMVKGIAMEEGGRTSHTAILARAFEIPAVLGVADLTKHVRNGDEIFIDGNKGVVVIAPDAETKARYETSQALWNQREVNLMGMGDLPAETRDGKLINLLGNIEVPEEVDALKAYGAEGIGLYRSEFLFLHPGRLPTEDLQHEAYGRVLRAMTGKTVTIRTLDLGGDKIIPDLVDSAEKNPLLGWRAIRFCLSRVQVFKTQLRAMLRASVQGKLKIMFPMISGVEELSAALEIVEEVKQDLKRAKVKFDENVSVGCMIEIPSAAMTSDILAKKVDFFSIGTNDLIQYSVAVDRGNPKTAYLYEPFHPAVLRLIKMTIDNAHAVGLPVGMCGEMAGDPLATVILLGLGLDEFSMTPSSIPEVKKIIRSVSMAEAEEIVGDVMEMRAGKDVDGFVRQLMEKRFDVVSY